MTLSDLIGIPYKKGGRDITGFDCFGLVKEVYSRLGVDIGETIEKLPFIKIENPRKYCIIVFKNTEHLHCGICLDERRFLHASPLHGVCIEDIEKWKENSQEYYSYNQPL